MGKSAARGMDLKPLEYSEREGIAKGFGIAPALAAEIMFKNDEAGGYWNIETPEQRWSRMRAWVASQILPAAIANGEGRQS